MFTRILIPTDYSDNSRRAMEVGLQLANLYQARVLCLHAADEVGQATIGLDTMDEVESAIDYGEERLTRAMRDRLRKLRAKGAFEVSDDAVDIRVVSGAPAPEILRAAEDFHADLIVMGTHGRTGLADKLLGSTAERVMRRARCSVFTVKPEDFPFNKP